MITISRSATTVIGLVAAIASFGFAHAAVPVGQPVMLVNVKTGKCLTIAGGTSTANSLPTVQYNCDEDLSRRWVITQAGGGYQVKNARTNKCLTVEGGTSSENNLRTVQFDCDDDPSRRWKLIDMSGSYQLKNVKTEKCATIAGGTSSDNNIEGVQYDCDDDTSRTWTLAVTAPNRPAPSPAPAPTAAYKTSDWSAWSRKDGVEFRSRFGWNTADARQVDAIFQVRNLLNERWLGSARSVDCSNGTLSASTDVDLQPGQTREVKFKTRNCGTAAAPHFLPSVARSGFL